MMVWVYTFDDGTILKLLEVGLSTEEVWKLQELHGACKPSWEKIRM